MSMQQNTATLNIAEVQNIKMVICSQQMTSESLPKNTMTESLQEREKLRQKLVEWEITQLRERYTQGHYTEKQLRHMAQSYMVGYPVADLQARLDELGLRD